LWREAESINKFDYVLRRYHLFWFSWVFKFIFISLYLFTWVLVGPVLAEPAVSEQPALMPPAPRLTAEAAVLIEGSSGQVIFEKNAYQARPPASTTKIMATLIALERANLNDLVTIGPRAPRAGGSTIGLRSGQVYPLGELLEGALIPSGNDACVAIGEYIGENESHFVQLMNQKAISLGARNTYFRNTNGMPVKGHYSTAYDLALIARYALRNSEFARIVSSQYATVSPVEDSSSVQKGGLSIKNTNALLWSYPGADGVKTGTTQAAGKCLVASATRDGRQLIAVVLKSHDRFGDSARLLDYGFQNFVRVGVINPGEIVAIVPIEKGNPSTVEAVAQAQLELTVPNQQAGQIETVINVDEHLRAPLQAGTKVGEVILTCEGKELQKVPLITSQTVMKNAPWWELW
jgi:D-alanyl-D-alanine carboxypeptidase (penicillin-binding protein 5/6)